MTKKNIVVLGSSGSIGENTLEVARRFKGKLRVLGLSVGSRTDKLESQLEEFKAPYAGIASTGGAAVLDRAVRARTKIFEGRQGLCELASLKDADIVVIAIVGFEAVFPLLSAIRARKTIALANKESIVVGGGLIMAEARRYQAKIIPIDSEQSAIFQCLEGYTSPMARRIFLTASGGPLVDWTKSRLRNVGAKSVLSHPRWKMGPKISVDSATLMNKGLEVIEASHLFGISVEQIQVLVHRQALVHSMVEFMDGSILAQMGVTDMKLPIQYALSYPERWESPHFVLDPLRMGDLSFQAPDVKKFPCLGLAYEAARSGGSAPCVLNAANEEAVAAFLRGELPFGRIPDVIEKVLRKGTAQRRRPDSIEDIYEADAEAREAAGYWLKRFSKKG
ncbi:MAG: 1-deoxy-D-xylulose-5-phosphate reductoisomerase [Candidatus Omnitrophota bacterium]